MTPAWIATVIAAAALAGALGCIARAYSIERAADMWGWVMVAVAFSILFVVMAAAAVVLYLFASTNFS